MSGALSTSSAEGQANRRNHEWAGGHSRGINMCHLDRRVNLSVPRVMCCALSCAFICCCLSSKWLSPGVSHIDRFSLATRGPRRCCRKRFPWMAHWVTQSMVIEVCRGQGSWRGCPLLPVCDKMWEDLQPDCQCYCIRRRVSMSEGGKRWCSREEWVEFLPHRFLYSAVISI